MTVHRLCVINTYLHNMQRLGHHEDLPDFILGRVGSLLEFRPGQMKSKNKIKLWWEERGADSER
jgi:hypothetical protein